MSTLTLPAKTPQRRRKLHRSAFILHPFLALLAACTAPTAAPNGLTPTPAATGEAVSPTAAGPSATPRPTVPPPTPTPTPIELVVCQTDEPASLYLYGDDVTARQGIFEALFDGPIDTVGYALQPVILQGLPSVEAGTAGVAEVEVAPGQRVMDGATGALVPLAEGVQLRQVDGSLLAYAGSAPARTVQTWAEFALLPNLQWSDGAPLTAGDSVFSYEVAAAAPTPAVKFLVDRTAGYTALDALRTRWTGVPGWVDTGFARHFFTPLARHRYGDFSPQALLESLEINEAPLGWGPYLAVSGGWVRGQSLTLLKNPYYHRAAEGLPSPTG
jgi:peptide/nickel transport system substrate-binding protein